MLRVHVQRGEAPASVYVFEDTSIVVGRGHGADLVLPFADVSRRQCRLVVTAGSVAIEELSTSGGTFVDGVRVRGRVMLGGASRVRFGAFTMWARVDGEPGEEAARTPGARGGGAQGGARGRGAGVDGGAEGSALREVAGSGGDEEAARGEAEARWLAEAAERWCERGRPSSLLLERRMWARARAALGKARALHPDDPRVALVEASGRALRERLQGRGVTAAIAAAAIFAGVAAGGGFEEAWPEVGGRAPSRRCEVGPGPSAGESIRALEDGIRRGCRTERAEAAMWAAMAGRDAVWIGRVPGPVEAIAVAPGGRGAVVEVGRDTSEGDESGAARRWWIDEAVAGMAALDGEEGAGRWLEEVQAGSDAEGRRGGRRRGAEAGLGSDAEGRRGVRWSPEEARVVARSDGGGRRAVAAARGVEVWAGERALARWPAPGEGSVSAIEVAEDGTTLARAAGRWYLRRVGDRRWRGLGEVAALCGAGCAVVGGRDGGISRVAWEGRRWRARRLTSMAAPVSEIRRAGEDAVVAVGAEGSIARVSLTASWRREGEALRVDLRRGGGRVRSWSVSTSGRVLAVVDGAGRVELWAIGDAGARAVDLPHEDGAGAIGGHGDREGRGGLASQGGATAVGFVGEVLVVGDARGDIWRRSMAVGEDGAGGVVHEGAVRALALAGDGRGVSVDAEGMIRLWRAGADGMAHVDGEIGVGPSVRALAIEAEGRWVAAAIGGDVWVWDGKDTGGERVEVRRAGRAVTRLAFGGRWLVAGDDEGGIVGWEIGADGVAREGRLWGQHAGGITALAASGEVVASGDAQGRVRRWQGASAEEPTAGSGSAGSSSAGSASAEGPMAGRASAEEPTVESGRGAVVTLLVEGGRSIVGRADGEVWIDDGGGAVRVMPGRGGPRAIAATPGGALVAIAGAVGEVGVWREGRTRMIGGGFGEPVGLGFASEARLVVVDAAGDVWLASVESAGEEVTIGPIGRTGEGAGGRGVVVAASGGVVASGGADGRVKLWPATPGGALLAGCRRLGVGCR